MATSVTHNNITWTFNGDYTVGQYVNGDYWVLGPVTIVNITPQSIVSGGRTMHGSMINPGASPAQAFDSAMQFTSFGGTNAGRPGGATISGSNPLVVANGSSLISTRSHATAGQRPQLLDAAVLTVLSSAPPAGAFRPPYVGTNKAHNWNTSQIDVSWLPSLSPPPNTPNLSTVTQLVERFALILHNNPNGTRFNTPLNNQNSYGARYAAVHTLGLLSLCLNYPTADKMPLLIRLIQRGIDHYGLLANGLSVLEGGGLYQGHKGCVVLAGHILNNAAIKSVCAGSLLKFQEDRQLWHVTSSDVGRSMYTGDGYLRKTYTSSQIGLAEWGEQHTRNQTRDDSGWPDAKGYRNINFDDLLGQTLAARLIGMRSLWNWQAAFDYADRAWAIEKSKTPGGNQTGAFSDSGFNQIQAFTHSMYTAYRSIGDGSGGTVPDPAVSQPQITAASSVFYDSVQVSMSVSNPPGATIRYTTDGSDPTSSSTVYSAPLTISSSTQLKAKGFAASYNDSTINSRQFTKRFFTSTSLWTSFAIPTQTGTDAVITLSATPSTAPLDSVIGFGNVEASSYLNLAAAVQFDQVTGTVRARNGGSYAAVNTFTYSAGVKYALEFTINVVAKTYSLTITAPGGSPITIATNYAFRTEQSGISSITHMSAVTTGSNNTVVENILVGEVATPTDPVASPEFSPTPGSYFGSTAVTITSATPGASLYYTTNGTEPTTSSTLYSGPITAASNTTIKVLGVKSGFLDSQVITGDYAINSVSANEGEWSNLGIGDWFDDIEIEFDAEVTASPEDAIFGVGPNLVSAYAGLAVNLRFATSGNIEVRNGAGYASEATVPYSANTSYHFLITTDMATKTYSVTVTPEGGSPTVLATGYAFRADQANATKLSYVAATVTTALENILISNISVSLASAPPAPPVRTKRKSVVIRRAKS